MPHPFYCYPHRMDRWFRIKHFPSSSKLKISLSIVEISTHLLSSAGYDVSSAYESESIHGSFFSFWKSTKFFMPFCVGLPASLTFHVWTEIAVMAESHNRLSMHLQQSRMWDCFWNVLKANSHWPEGPDRGASVPVLHLNVYQGLLQEGGDHLPLWPSHKCSFYPRRRSQCTVNPDQLIVL